jgi:hypothetical protein
MNRRTRTRCVAVAAAATLVALPSALGASQQLAYRFSLERLPGTTLLYTIENVGTTPIKYVAIRGTDFTITGASAVSAGGGPAVCAVSGNPATLTCRNFELRPNARLVAMLSTTRPATTAEHLVSDSADPARPFFSPVSVMAPMPRGTVRYQKQAGGRGLIIGQNTGYVTFTKIRLVTRKSARVRVLSFRVVSGGRSLAATAGPPCRQRDTATPGNEEIVCATRLKQKDIFYLALRNFGSGAVKHLVWETADGGFYNPES